MEIHSETKYARGRPRKGEIRPPKVKNPVGRPRRSDGLTGAELRAHYNKTYQDKLKLKKNI